MPIIKLINTINLNLLELTYLNKWIVEQICNTMKNKVEILQGHKKYYQSSGYDTYVTCMMEDIQCNFYYILAIL